jgi:hypothetical protein
VPELSPLPAAAADHQVKDEDMSDEPHIVPPASIKVKAAAAIAAAAAHETGEAERLHTPRRSRLLSGGDTLMGTIGEGPEEEEQGEAAGGLDALAAAAVGNEDLDDLPMLEEYPGTGYEAMPGPGEGFGEGGDLPGRAGSPDGSWGSSNAGSGAAAAGDLEERDDLGEFDSIAADADAGAGAAGDMSMLPSSPVPGTPGRTDDITPGGAAQGHGGKTAGDQEERGVDGPVVQPFDMWAAQVRLWLFCLL